MELSVENKDNDFEESKNDENSFSDESPVNILREYTFNEDLMNLIEKIRSNESSESLEIESPNINKEELLIRLHSLFYKSINLLNLENVNTRYNPFVLLRQLGEKNLSQIIQDGLNEINLKQYAVLSFKIGKKCYLPVCNYIEGAIDVNLAIDTAEELYNRIISSGSGITMDSKAISKDVFLSKRFSHQGLNDGLVFFMISFQNIFDDIMSEMGLIAKKDVLIKNLFHPILIALVQEKDIESILQHIKTRLSIYLFLFEKTELDKINIVNFENLHNVFTAVEHIIQVFSKYEDCIYFIIKYKGILDNEMLFTFRYLQTKIKNELSDKSIVLQIEKGKLLIMTHKSEGALVRKIFLNLDKLYNNAFSINFYGENKNTNIVNLIKEYLE